MPDLGAFGWAHLLTSIGLILSGSIAFFGFRTFERWKREMIEERRIEVAFETLALAYEAKYIFDHIRSPLSTSVEWADMPTRPGETAGDRSRRGAFYAAFKRIEQNKEFFERVWKLQPRCMAVFGRGVEGAFMKLHKARRRIEVAAEMLADPTLNDVDVEADRALVLQMRRDLWALGQKNDQEDGSIGALLREFEQELERIAQPIVAGKY